MIPSCLEYILLLLIAGLALSLVLGKQARQQLKKGSFWVAFVPFFALCTTFDYYGLHERWFEFHTDRILGFFILTIPVEEYVLFFLLFLFVTAAWERL